MTLDQINALNSFALAHRQGWQHLLAGCWARSAYPASTSSADKALLQQLRNQGGPTLIATFRPRHAGYKMLGLLQQTPVDRAGYNQRSKPIWQIVSETGAVLSQAGFDSKLQAQKTAEDLGIFLTATAK